MVLVSVKRVLCFAGFTNAIAARLKKDLCR